VNQARIAIVLLLEVLIVSAFTIYVIGVEASPATPYSYPTSEPTLPPTPTYTATPSPLTSVASEGCHCVPKYGYCDVYITIETDDPQGIGSATIALTVDTTVVSVGNVAAGDLGKTVFSYTVGDTTTMSVATGSSPRPTGTLTFATVTLSAVGNKGECSDLDIEVPSMYDGMMPNPQAVTKWLVCFL
jgi:hypothetical protein